MKLENKTIVLTGASSGVGLDILRQIGPANRVIGLSRNAPPAEVVQAAQSYTHIATDLADANSVAEAVQEVVKRHQDAIDGLINCGAVQFTPRFVDPEFDSSLIAKEIAINLTSPIELIAALIANLSAGKDPFIMNINSGLGIVPKHESAVYCATKAALDNFSRGLRAQLAGTDIVVQQAFLPLVDTPMTAGRGTGKLTSKQVASQIIGAIQRRSPDTDIGKVKLLRGRSSRAQRHNDAGHECAFQQFHMAANAENSCSQAPVWLQLPVRNSVRSGLICSHADESAGSLLIPANESALNPDQLLIAQQFLLRLNSGSSSGAHVGLLAKPPAYDDVAVDSEQREPPPPYTSQLALNTDQSESSPPPQQGSGESGARTTTL